MPDQTIYLPPTADRPTEPAPFVLTEEDMVRLLRLENSDPYQTLWRYRDRGWLTATQVGNKVRFLLPNVVKFLMTATEENPR